MKVLAYFPHNPFPPRSGAHHRCRQVLDALVGQGHEVTLASNGSHSEPDWTSHSLDFARQAGYSDVLLYREGLAGKLERRAERWGRILRRQDESPLHAMACPPEMQRWFRRVLAQVKPDVVLVNYAYFEPFRAIAAAAGVRTVLETHDLLTTSFALRARAARLLAECDRDAAAVDAVEPAAWSSESSPPSPEEIAVLRRFDTTIFISAAEQRLAAAAGGGGNFQLLPFTMAALPGDKLPGDEALFVAGANPFNELAVRLLTHRVVPAVVARCPDFRVRVAGRVPTAGASRHPAVSLAGGYEEVAPLYASCRLVVSPVFGGTGQQIKISEAMAHGRAVVAFASIAGSSPLIAGETGRAEHDVEGMVRALAELWSDPEACRRYGQAGRLALDRQAEPFTGERIAAIVLGG